MLMVAWSSVSFNLPQIYGPVTATLLGVEPEPPNPRAADIMRPPRLEWRAAHRRAQMIMADVARREGFVVHSERLMFLEPATHIYSYRVLSNRDPGRTGNTQITFDGDTGSLLAISLPTGRALGTTVTSWIGDIHVADILSVPMKIMLTVTGLAIAFLSVTGVWPWWRKRAARKRMRSRRAD